MEIIRYIAAAVFCLIGIWIGIMNWVTVYTAVKYKKTVSAAPFFGAVLMIIGLLIIPISKSWWSFFVSLIIDYSCLPWMISKIISMLRK